MLHTIREKITGWAAAIIIGVLSLSLVITFGNIDTGFTPASTAFTVNGEDVAISEFRALYQQQRREWETNFKAQMPPELAESMARSVIDNLVRNRVMTQYVDKQGYRVSNAEVIDSIRGTPAFQVGGQFSQPAYEQMLNSQGLSPQRFEYDQRRSMEMRQYAEGVAFTAFYTPAQFRRYIALDGESRKVEYFVLPADNWADDVQISEEAVAQRYEQDKSRYQTTENVSLEYIVVDYADLLEEMTVSDAELRKYYDENPQEFTGPDDREVSHILIAASDDAGAAEQQALQLAAELEAGASFAALAAEYSDDTASAARGGSLGWLGSGDAPAQEFEDAMLALVEPGDISPPVRTEFGYHLIRLDGLRVSASRSFAEVAPELRERLREDNAADRYAELVEELDDRALESLDGLAPVAAALDLELQTLDGFTRNGGGDLGFSPALVDTVFRLEVLEDGENSPAIQLDDGRAIVLRVTEHYPSVIKPLDDVKDEIRAVLAQEKAVELGSLATDDMVTSLNSGQSLDQVLPGAATMLVTTTLRRGDATAPAELVAEIFRAPKPTSGEPKYISKLLASGGFAIFRVTEAVSGRPDNFSQADRDVRKQQLSAQLGGGHINAIVESLMAEADVRLTPDLIENLLGTNP